jgi:predicted ATP-dependent serine protease
MPLYECVSCLHQKAVRLRPLICVECGRSDTYSLLGEEGIRLTAVCASDISADEPARYETGDSELDSVLSGGFVRPSTSTIFGRGGTGKSRSALRWATRLGPALLVSLEMPSKLAVQSAKSARANLAELYVTESEHDWQAEASRIKARCVVFDSFHYSQKQKVIKGSKVPTICHELSEWAKATDGLVFMICHSNKRNEVSGTTSVEHWPDYLFKFAKHGSSEAKVTIPKARYCPTGACIITI